MDLSTTSATTGAPPAPDSSPTGELLGQLAREAEAQRDLRQRGDLVVHAALLAWDQGDGAASAAFLEQARALAPVHPLAHRLLVAHALSTPLPPILDRAETALRTTALPATERAAMLRDLGEAWLCRAGDPLRAAAALKAALATGTDPDARALLPLALAMAGEWRELAELQRSALAAGGATVDLLEAGHLANDRLNDGAAAAQLYGRAASDDDPVALDHLVELAHARVPGAEPAAILRRRLDTAGLRPAPGPDREAPELQSERSAITYQLAVALERQGQLGEAAALFTALAGDPTPFGGRLLMHDRRRVAQARGAWDEVAAACRDLARGQRPPVARAFLRRAAEIHDARLGQADRAIALYADLLDADPDDLAAARALERLRLRAGAHADVIRQLELSAPLHPTARAGMMRRAAAIAESLLGDVDQALRLRRDLSGGAGDSTEPYELLRLYRKQGDKARMAQAYRRLAQLASDDRAAAAYRAAGGVAELLAGRAREADEALREAARATPNDLYPRLALATLYRKLGRWRELAEVLDGLAQLTASPTQRAACLRELGRITATRLGDPRGARAHLERALEASPDDAGLLEALADLAGESGDWPAAVSLRERALKTAGPARGAALLLEVGEIEERQRKDDEAARVAYERAQALDPQALGALRALAALHRKHRRPTELLRALRRELELTTDAARRLSLLLEIARTAESPSSDTRHGGEAGLALDAYRQVLAIDPANSPALSGFERICRRDGKWDLLADALAKAPRTPRNLKALAEALEKLERWGELAEVRKIDVDGAADKGAASRAAVALAQLHEEKLGDFDEAIRIYKQAFELDPTDPKPLRPLARLYETPGRERWAELVAVLDAELTLTPPAEVQRRIALLSRIGEVRRDRLELVVDAAQAFEAILELDTRNPVALAALESIYARTNREDELVRVLERKAEAADDPAARAEYFARIADLREKKGDHDAALACYRQAFLADSANRHIFTALERLCYKRERWSEAMELYDAAIAVIEAGKSRAYRLGDLYLRRGQVQLQYLQQPHEASESYLKVLELDPDNDNALRFLESIYSQESDWAALIRAYEKRADLTADDERRIDALRRAARVAAAKLKETAEAVRLYERILAIDPGDKESLDTLERFYEKGKDWNKLVGVLSSRLRAAPAGDAAVALLTRIAAICEEGLRDEGRAIEHYRKILEIAPGNAAALDALGRIYESTEKWPEFIDVTRRLIRITNDRNTKALLYFKCGSVMESKFGKEEDAIRYYDAAIKTSASCLPAVHGLRDVYLRRKEWAKVIQTLELEVKLWQDDKERAGVFAQIGHVYGDFLGEPDRALHYYESALAVDPDSLPANRALFELYFARGDWARAAPLGQALAQKAMREGDPSERSEFYRKRGVVALHIPDARSAAESFIIALEIKPENLAALDDFGNLMRTDPDVYDYNGTYRELEKIYRKRDDSGPHLARVLCAQAGLVERSGDLETAERVYREALMLAPHDFTVLLALVELNANMRHFPQAAETLLRFLDTKPAPAREVRVRALMRLAEIHGDGEMDALRAASVLRDVIRIDPANQDALYRLAQELYVAGRFAEARTAIEKVIEVAAAPGTHPSAEALARYYYYLGRVLEALGESRAAGLQYRRAAEYDPSYAPTALALGKRAVAAGDRRTAEATLINAAHAAMEKGGPRAAVPLQRGLARILLAHGDRQAAIEAYRGILAVEPEGSDDRVALAEIYALDDVGKAVSELYKVMDRDLRHPPAYRLLAAIYERTGEAERALRVNGILEILGYCDENERAHNAAAWQRHAFVPRRATLSEDGRQALLLPPAGRSILTEVYHTVAVDIAQLFAMPAPGTNLVPFHQVDDPAFKLAVTDNLRLFGLEGAGVEVYVGDDVLGGMIALQFPRPVVVMARALYALPDAERRFLLGRAFESLRGGYAPLLRLGPHERHDVGMLLRSLLVPDHQRPAAAQEFVARLAKKTQKALERFVQPGTGPASGVDPDAWTAALGQAQDRAGILACDDFAAAARALALLIGESVAVTDDGAVALGAVPGGTELVRYFLSDDYHRLRTALAGTV